LSHLVSLSSVCVLFPGDNGRKPTEVAPVCRRRGPAKKRPTVTVTGTASNYLQRGPSPSGLADVLDLILDKGLVVDAYVRLSLVGIEILTIDARIVIASVDTYLRFAEAVNRLDLTETELAGLPELQEKGAKKVTEHKLESKVSGLGND